MSLFFVQLPRFILQAMYSNSYDLTRALVNCPLSTPSTWLLADNDLAGYDDGGTSPIAHGIVSCEENTGRGVIVIAVVVAVGFHKREQNGVRIRRITRPNFCQ